jgi:light-regulated signal transduction histidine kinase (bacteriophytochrome)
VPAVVGALDRKRAETARAEAETMIRNSNMMLEREVNLRTTELKSAILELEEFNYSIAHDLRAPLRHISGYIGMIQRKLAGIMDAKTSQYMEVVSASADNMGSLIDSILDLSRISRSSLVYTRVNMDNLVSEARKILEREPGYCNVTWKTGPLPIVEGDAVMLSTVMINLLSNALKFSRTVTSPVIEVGQQHGHPGYDVIYVKDNGIGFDMKYYSKLYKLFERLCPEKGYEGTGIGLVNVKRIILKHGGRTWAEGEDGKGAVFYFSLPKR